MLQIDKSGTLLYMPSMNAQKVARIVIDKVNKGVPISMKDAIRESGAYSPSIATHPSKVTNTQSYKDAKRWCSRVG